MKKIGIISDTHSYWDDKYLHYFEPCDEIWHAGDIGSTEVADRLAEFRTLRAVCGNCDGSISEAIQAITTTVFVDSFMPILPSSSLLVTLIS